MSCIHGKGPRISADIRGICPGYSSHPYLPISWAYATDICRYPVGGTQTLTLTEEKSENALGNRTKLLSNQKCGLQLENSITIIIKK